MLKNRSQKIVPLAILGDAIVMFVIALFGPLSPIPGEATSSLSFVFYMSLTLYLVWLIAIVALKLYKAHGRKAFLLRMAIAWVVAITVTLLVRSLIFGEPFPNLEFLAWVVIDGFVYLLLWRTFVGILEWIYRNERLPILQGLVTAGIAVGVLSVLVAGGLYLRTRAMTEDDMKSVDTAVEEPVAIIFGAHVWWDGTPSTTLIHRVEKAAELYHAGKVARLLLSGDGRTESYNETKAMQDVALALDVPQEALILDYYGLRTYDTCARAHDLFDVDAAILVTQAFQLPRAVMLCEYQTIDSIGVPADEEPTAIRQQAKNVLREILATVLAYGDSWILKPNPVSHNDI
jgi:vancomycin permeability regulator SanA